ncbi:MAG: ATP-dependent sacrificial sulfur transferase LarE [Chloroflexi bacterium]|nr:ATP-dependent sacrificial sulfur transferase LarE [Chloroflexota bacterium]
MGVTMGKHAVKSDRSDSVIAVPTPAEPSLAEKESLLENSLRDLGSVIVAYSGGVDSALVMSFAHRVLGAQAIAVTASSPSVAPEELEAATALAESRGWRHIVVSTSEIEDGRYVANDGRRCFFCKTELYGRLQRIAAELDVRFIANGTNTDDLGDYRPGLEAAAHAEVKSPLVEAGICKQDVRDLAKRDGLSVWDKPAQPCLASRIPYGTSVSVNAMRMIATAERGLRSLGFLVVRVRHYGDTAKIELPLDDIPRFESAEIHSEATRLVLDAGYSSVELDQRGFRSGRLNDALKSS